MTKSTKAQKYSVEMVSVLTAEYNTQRENGVVNAEALEAVVKVFNAQFGETLTVTVPAVRSKLVSEGVYQKDENARKVGNASGVRKLSVVTAIEELLGLDKGALASLEKGAKPELELLQDAVETLLQEAYNAEDEMDEGEEVAE